MNALEIRNLSKRYPGGEYPAVHEVRLDVAPGMLCALVGESGSGKSTLLRMIAGLEIPDSGSIQVGSDMVFEGGTFVPPEKREVGLVFQDAALFPHLTVSRNIGFGLKGAATKDRALRVEQLLELVGLAGYGSRFPGELSGGEAQRVALARALAPKPKLLLLDEPFSSLDPTLRKRLRDEVRQILAETQTTAIFVTHDTGDAMAIGQRVAIMRGGVIVQVGEPATVYRSPFDAYCAKLFGPINRVPAQLMPQGKAGATTDESAFLWLRPEDLEVLDDQDEDRCVKVDVVDTVFQGEYQEVTLRVDAIHGEESELTVRMAPDLRVEPGQSVWVRLRETGG